MRTPAITRRIKGHTARVLCFDLTAMKTCEKAISIPKAYDSNTETRTKYVEKYFKDSVNIKFLAIQSWDVVDKLVGMKYDDFLRYAVELDENRRFPDGSDADET